MTDLLARLAAASALVLLTGCEVTSAPSAPATSNLTYFEDASRGLCFAAIASQTHGGYQVVSITNVPCSTHKAEGAEG